MVLLLLNPSIYPPKSWGSYLTTSLRKFSPFSIFRGDVIRLPIWRKNAIPDKAMDGRIRPIAWRFQIAVLDRIVMDVIHMPRKIVFIAYLMFPITALPYARLTPAYAVSQGFTNKSSSGFLLAGELPEARLAVNSSSILSR